MVQKWARVPQKKRKNKKSSSDPKYISPSRDESHFLVFLSLNIIKYRTTILIPFLSFYIPFLDFVLVVGWIQISNFEMTSPLELPASTCHWRDRNKIKIPKSPSLCRCKNPRNVLMSENTSGYLPF